MTIFSILGRNIIVAGFAIMLTPALSVASIYKWVDKHGNIHFSDQPHKGAQKVKLKMPAPLGTSSKTSDKNVDPGLSAFRNLASQERQSKKAHEYSVLKISQPLAGATIRNNNGAVIVHVTVHPQLSTNDKVRVLLDGQVMGEPQGQTSFTLTNVLRGAHTLAVQIVDSEEKVIVESDAIDFFMHRIRILNKTAPAKK